METVIELNGFSWVELRATEERLASLLSHKPYANGLRLASPLAFVRDLAGGQTHFIRVVGRKQDYTKELVSILRNLPALVQFVESNAA